MRQLKWLLYENSMQNPRQPQRKSRPECKAKILKGPKWTTDIHVIEPLEAWILLSSCIITTQRGKVVEAYEYNDVVRILIGILKIFLKSG
jgi:hypothetical protein